MPTNKGPAQAGASGGTATAPRGATTATAATAAAAATVWLQTIKTFS
jgi:hypothetical protein